MAALLVLWTVVALCRVCSAVPAIYFPINSQVPPVARVGHPFSFVFSPSTFSSNTQLTYSLANGPAWLAVDSASRRLYGTPGEADVTGDDMDGVHFDLLAADSSGSVTLTATIVVSRKPSPIVKIPLSQQIPDFGSFSKPSSIRTSPDTAFTLRFAKDTFTDPTGKGLTYYAAMADNTPLPSWVSFNASSLSFTGRTPTLNTLMVMPQSVSLQLLASDVVGFSAASLPFTIVFGKHKITADNSSVVLSATSGTELSYTELKSHVKYDGQDVQPETVSVASTPDIPAWLSVDDDTWEISGTPPGTAKSSNFTIVLRDTFSDTLNLTVSLNVTNGLFKSSLPELTIEAGEHFSLDLGSRLLNPSDTMLSISTTPRATWIRFESSQNVISGDAPEALTLPSITIEIHAKSRSSGLEVSQDLPVRVRTSTLEVASSTSSSRPTPTASSSANPDPASETRHEAPLKDILMATLIPTMMLLLVLACLIFCCLRRRRGESSTAKKTLSGTKDRAKDSFQSFINHSISHSSSLTRRLSPQKSYAQAAIGSLKKLKPDRAAFPTLLSPYLPRSDSPPVGEDAHTSTKETWLAVITRKVFRKESGKGYLPRTSLNDEKQKGVIVGASHHENAPVHPLSDATNPFEDSPEAGIPASDMTSAQSAPNFDYSGKDDLESGSPHRATTFGEFTSVASNSGASNSQPESLPTHPTPVRTASRLTGNVTRFMSNLRKKKESTTGTPGSELPGNVTVPSPLIHPQPASGDRPVTRRGLDRESNDAGQKESENGAIRPPNRAVSTSALIASSLSQLAARKKAARDSLGVPYDRHIPGPPPAFATKTWSTLHSSNSDEQGASRDAEGQGTSDKSKKAGQPMETSVTSTTLSSQANWTVLHESPEPSVWRAGGTASAATRANGSLWPKRPKTACDPHDTMSASSSHYGTRPPSRRRDWIGAAVGGGSRHSRVPSSRFGGPGPSTYSVANSVGSGPGASGELGRDKTLGSAAGSEDSYGAFI